MTFHPGGPFGLPPGVPSPLFDLGWWRYLLTAVALAAAWLELRGRRGAAVAAAAGMAVLAVGFWVLALGRPYGVLADDAITRWAARVSVAARAGGADGFLVGEPGLHGVWAALTRAGLPAELLLFLPTWMPLVVLLATAAVAARIADREEAALTTILWLGASTGALETLRGAGLVTGAWPRPLAAGALIVALVLVAALPRALGPRATVAATVVIVGAAALLAPAGPRLGALDVLRLATLDQWPWIVPAAWVARHAPEVKPRALMIAGGVGLLVGLVRGGDALWIGQGAYRLGVVVLAAHGLHLLLGRAAHDLLPSRLPPRAPAAALVLLVLCGSTLVWWDPTRMDPVVRASLDPVSPALLETMDWVRGHTPPSAVFVAGEDYAPSVAVLGGRRVLRAPTLATAPDDERRRRAQRAILSGREVPDLVDRYSLGYVLIAPGQFRDEAAETADLDGRAGLRLVYASPRGVRVYEMQGRGTRRVE